MFRSDLFRPQARGATRDFFRFKGFRTEDGVEAAEIHIFDAIDPWGADAKDIVPIIRSLEVEAIHVLLNTPGGDVFDGFSIANALREKSRAGVKVTTEVTGLAASIGSAIAAAGDVRLMHPDSMLMVHRAWGVTVGSAPEHRQQAATLDKIDARLVSIYDRVTNRDQSEIESWMDAETWFTADEASEVGFADVIDAPDVRARVDFDLSIFRNVPKALATEVNAERIEQARREVDRAELVPQAERELLRRRLALIDAA